MNIIEEKFLNELFVILRTTGLKEIFFGTIGIIMKTF